MTATTVPTTDLARPADAASPTGALMAGAAALGPVVLLGSSLAWLAGDDVAELRGILTFWAFPALALAVVGLAGRLEERAPVGRAVITGLSVVGAVAGGAFAQEINMVDFFGTERLIRQDTPSAMIALGLPGVLFPASVVVTGVLSALHRTLPRRQAGLLAAAGALFPLSRIPEKPALAVVADALLVAALVPAALRTWRHR